MMQETIVTTNRVTFSVEKGFCIVLCRLAYPQRLANMERIFGMSDSAIGDIFNTMIKWLARRIDAANVLSWDFDRLTPETLETFAAAVRRKGLSCPNVCLCFCGRHCACDLPTW